MVALVFLHLAGVVAAFLADGHRLRGARFAARHVTRPGKDARARAPLGHADHGLAHHGNVLGLVAQVQRRLGCHRHHSLGQGVTRGHDDLGLVLDAVVGQRGRGLGQLQHGEVVVALANAQRNGFTGVPLFLLRFFVIVALPVLAGQEAAQLALQVNAGDLPEAQGLHEVVNGVHPHLVGQRVVVHIAGLDDAGVHVHRPQAMVAVAAKGVAAKHPGARVIDHGGGRAFAGLQGGQRHERLVGGARRVAAAQRPVEQRLVQRLIEAFPALRVDAVDKQVGVERGLADKSQYLPGLGVEGHQRAPALAKHLLHHALQLDVDGQHDGVAGCGRAAGQLARGVAAGRGFH